MKTNARFERITFPWWTLSGLRDQERIVLFTHEWAMGVKTRFIMEQSLKWLREHHYEFTFLEN